MIPGVLFAAIVAVRLIAATSSASGAGAPPPPPISPAARRALRFILVWMIALPACGYVALAPPRTLVTYIPGSIFLVSVLWWPLLRRIMIPLGLVRATYYLGLGAWTSSEDRAGAALLAASLAFHRKRGFSAEDAAWIEEKIQQQKTLRSGGVAAAASMAAARGDRDGARALFESIRTMDAKVRSSEANQAATEWLAADAAARGKWEEVIALGDAFSWSGRAAWLLAGVGMRLLGKSFAPSRPMLVARWLLSPGRLRTFAIVERALSVPDGAAPLDDEDDDAPVPAAAQGDLLGAALAMHVRLLSSKKPTPAAVAAVGRAFDAAFEEASLTEHVQERGALLGAQRPEVALTRLRRDVEESLFQLLKGHRVALDDAADDLGIVAASAQRRLRDELLTVIEALSDAVRSRVNEKRPLPVIDEWREWTALRIAYERGVALGGPELRYLAFTKVHSDVCALAVWLFNERGERPIANAMFRFLLAEAQATGDEAGIELQKKNVDCGI